MKLKWILSYQGSWDKRRRNKVTKRIPFLISILMIYFCSSGWAQTPLDFPEKALRLIADSTKNPCSICAQQTEQKAFQLF